MLCIVGLGGVLMQDGQPVAYESKKFSEAQQHWTTHEQEMYAVIYILIMSPSSIQTQPKLTPKQGRWQDFLAEFDVAIVHKPGKQNVMPHALRRMPHVNAVVCYRMLASWMKSENRSSCVANDVLLDKWQNLRGAI